MSRRTFKHPGWIAALVVVLVAAASCCSTAIEIRIHNASSLDFTDVRVAGESYGDLAAGETSPYRSVDVWFRYALIELTAGGTEVNAQTLNLWGKRFTHEIEILDLAAGHLAVDVVRD